MDLSSNLDEYIHESIEHSLGLPVSAKTLEMKLLAAEEAQRRLQDQIFLLQDRMKEKDQRIERSRAEAQMSAQALRKCIEENQKLSAECADLLSKCAKWEKECTLYDQDREALMEFGNDADERAKEAEIRALEAENSLTRLAEELKYYKHECEILMTKEASATQESLALRRQIDELEHARLQGCRENHLGCSQCSSQKENQEPESHLLATVSGDSSGVITVLEGHILDKVVSSLLGKGNTTRQAKDEVEANAHSFLEAHMGQEQCQRFWKRVKPLTKYILALAAGFESLQKDKEHLRINLHRAEEEVKVLFEENNMLDKEHEKLLRKTRERHEGSEGKHSTSVSAKGKRKLKAGTTISTDRIIDFCGLESPRRPLSPLQLKSPESRMQKK
ncbi:myocardial zonula adherens protein [Cinnamomum micranthum f. kanehirae]|uniref:Myocardial zonula adherens protein n=1 Tax=Cinnamomum micranthum f. kanehirae TaxID=337451 RepID=A0A443PQ32_9MAGN|nr:myocardial zonula adherens protein [Cinnamomum micranthum f. kanehirae]